MMKLCLPHHRKLSVFFSRTDYSTTKKYCINKKTKLLNTFKVAYILFRSYIYICSNLFQLANQLRLR